MTEPHKEDNALDEAARDIEAATADNASGEAPAAAAPASDDPETLRRQLDDAQRLLAEADLRSQAEVQNIRRRAERDVANAHKFALDRFTTDLLAVADSLERGLSTLSADDARVQPAREGLELTLRALLDAFTRHGIEQINPTGESFNPEQHEAMTMIPAPGVAPNTVVEVLEKGYLLNGRLIRPARVVVSRSE